MSKQHKGIAMRPGPGWKRLSGAVWENEELRVRVHRLGLISIHSSAGKHKLSVGRDWGLRQELDQFERFNGGNSLRGLLGFAAHAARLVHVLARMQA